MATYANKNLGAKKAVLIREVSNDYSVGLAKFFTDSFVKLTGDKGAIVATLALFVPASILTLAVARVYDRYRGRDWHTALEKGLAPVAVGLIFAGAISIIRLSGDGALTWAAAVGAGLTLTLRPKLHPFVVLFAGAGLFVAAQMAGLWPVVAP